MKHAVELLFWGIVFAGSGALLIIFISKSLEGLTIAFSDLRGGLRKIAQTKIEAPKDRWTPPVDDPYWQAYAATAPDDNE